VIAIAADIDATACLGEEEERRRHARTSSRDISTPERINQILGKLIAPTVPITARQIPETLKI